MQTKGRTKVIKTCDDFVRIRNVADKEEEEKSVCLICKYAFIQNDSMNPLRGAPFWLIIISGCWSYNSSSMRNCFGRTHSKRIQQHLHTKKERLKWHLKYNLSWLMLNFSSFIALNSSESIPHQSTLACRYRFSSKYQM